MCGRKVLREKGEKGSGTAYAGGWLSPRIVVYGYATVAEFFRIMSVLHVKKSKHL